MAFYIQNILCTLFFINFLIFFLMLLSLLILYLFYLILGYHPFSLFLDIFFPLIKKKSTVIIGREIDRALVSALYATVTVGWDVQWKFPNRCRSNWKSINREWITYIQNGKGYMECLLRFACAPAPLTAIVSFPSNTQKKKRNGWFFRAQLSDENDPLLQSAVNSASLRFHETHRRGKQNPNSLYFCLFYSLLFSFWK